MRKWQSAEAGDGGQETGMSVQTVKELEVYITAYRLAMRIFEVSKRFPEDEKYSLTSQIRRSSRSVCLNLREAWAKRRYEEHFVSKLTDCDGESNETDSSLDFAKD
jgi:four helix bundle protein